MRTLNLVISICAVVVVTWITSILTYFDHLATMDYKKDYDSHSFENFDWIAYLELNPLIAKSLPYRSSYFAFRHYKTEGVKKGIPFTSLYPNGISLQLAMSKLEVFTRNVDIKNYMKNTLVVIHLHEKDITESNGVLQNNLILINDAIQRDGGVLSESEMSNNFYWINIIRRRSHENHVGAKDIVNGGILQYLSCFSQHNVAVAYWQISPSDMHTHFQTLSFLWKTINRYIASVMLLNQGVRGPFSMRNRGDWVAHFRSKLFGPNNLALFGPTMSCEVRAHVQTHAVMIKMEVVTTIINEYKQFKLVENWIELVRRYEVNLSKLMLKNGYYIDATWRPNCTSTSRAIHSAFTNPSSQHLPISDLVLIKWGGEMLRRRGFISPEMAVDVRHQTKEVLTTTPNLPLIDLEYFRGGIWSKLHLEYDKEFAHSSSLNERMGEIRKPCSNFVCILRVDEDINITRNTSLQTSLGKQIDSCWKLFNFETGDEAPTLSMLLRESCIYTNIARHNMWYGSKVIANVREASRSLFLSGYKLLVGVDNTYEAIQSNLSTYHLARVINQYHDFLSYNLVHSIFFNPEGNADFLQTIWKTASFDISAHKFDTRNFKSYVLKGHDLLDSIIPSNSPRKCIASGDVWYVSADQQEQYCLDIRRAINMVYNSTTDKSAQFDARQFEEYDKILLIAHQTVL